MGRKERDTMHDTIQQRMETLRKELEKGQQHGHMLEQELTQVRETMLRISGAIQVLEEIQKETAPVSEGSEQNGSTPDRAATGTGALTKGA